LYGGIILKLYPITQEDYELVEEARNIIKKHYKHSRHQVGAAIRTKSGKIITAVNIEAYLRKVDICAEAIAIGKAILEDEDKFESIVAVRYPHPYEERQEIKVVSPCGMCRELIYDYGSHIKVIISNNDTLEKYSIGDLLPFKYRRK
jgi:cytidine deaminase